MDEEMLEKMEVGKNSKECFAKIGEYRKMQDGLWGQMMQLDSPELKKGMEKFRDRYCETAFYEITEHDGLKSTFIWGDPPLQLHAIELQLDSGAIPSFPIPARLLQTFFFFASPWIDQLLPRHQVWTCSTWEPSQCHER
jgi:hypothetical protein